METSSYLQNRPQFIDRVLDGSRIAKIWFVFIRKFNGAVFVGLMILLQSLCESPRLNASHPSLDIDKQEGIWPAVVSMMNVVSVFQQSRIESLGRLFIFANSIPVQGQPMDKKNSEAEGQDAPNQWWCHPFGQVMFCFLLGVLTGYVVFSNER